MKSFFAAFLALVLAAPAAERPNILWLTCEDISPDLGCYGQDYAITPHLDRFAANGVRFNHAVGITGVCAVNRSCLVTGMYSSSLGSQDMRSRITLPQSIRAFPAYLREAGYYCTNNSKTDYNFAVPADAWDACSGKAHWKGRSEDQPFFAVFNYTGSHESQIWERNHARHEAKLKPSERHDPATVPIPPFHPDTPEVRRDWANYHDNITGLDHWFAGKLEELERAGLAEETIVFFYSDHGAGMPGVKKWVWEGGLRVPLLIRYPEKWAHLAPKAERAPGTVTDRLVSFVDFAPTVLSLCGLDIPEHMQGVAFSGPGAGSPRDHAYVIRDRMAERYDFVRGVRDRQFLYLRHFMPHLPWSQHVSYTHRMPTMQVWQRLHEEGKLSEVQDRYFQPKPSEELYDLAADPHCVRNLAGDPDQSARLRRMRQEVHHWQLRTRDLGPLPWFEIERRSEGTTPFELARDREAYPLQALLAAAGAAASRDAAAGRERAIRLGNSDPAVRWWGVQAFVMLGADAAGGAGQVRPLLSDPNPVVRVAAAEFFATLGDAETALPVLSEALGHPSPDVRLRAMNVLDRLGEAARPVLPAIRRAALEKAPFPADYLNRMVDYVPARIDPR